MPWPAPRIIPLDPFKEKKMPEISDLKIKVTVEGVDGAITELERLKRATRQSYRSFATSLFIVVMIAASTYAAAHDKMSVAIWLLLMGILAREK